MQPEFAGLDAALRARARPLEVWWRDDDAGTPHANLHRLLDLAGGLGWPVALAVIPAALEAPAADAILACPRATVLQHGWSHEDRAGPGAPRRIELGGTWPSGAMAEALGRGRRALEAAFGARFRPVMVPPWNRIEPRAEALLPGLGFEAVSALRGPVPGADGPLPRLDVDLDLERCRRDGAGVGRAAAGLARLAAGGAARAGLMTHHRPMDGSAFEGLATLLGWLRVHEGVRTAPLPEPCREPPAPP